MDAKKAIAMVEYGCRFIAKPYIWGGNGCGLTNLGREGHFGFDCSGFVNECLAAFGFIPNYADYSAQGLYTMFKDKWAQVLPEYNTGTLVFFGKDENSITHVAICVNGWQMIECGGGGKRCTNERNSTGFVRLRPINSRDDVVAMLDPV